VTTWTVPTPLGPLAVEATAQGKLRSLRLGQEADREDEPVREIDQLLRAYFDGEDINALDRLRIDLEGQTPFRRAVLEALREVTVGKLTTYGALAAAAGSPAAARAVGQVMGSNPLPIVIPCHRVVASGGTLGGYGSGLATKRWLLQHEGVDELPGGWEPRPRRRGRL
jgi:methylated-DNA-[protein]-cysteine S-methyltransferase